MIYHGKPTFRTEFLLWLPIIVGLTALYGPTFYGQPQETLSPKCGFSVVDHGLGRFQLLH